MTPTEPPAPRDGDDHDALLAAAEAELDRARTDHGMRPLRERSATAPPAPAGGADTEAKPGHAPGPDRRRPRSG